jgi:hypothetical protein
MLIEILQVVLSILFGVIIAKYKSFPLTQDLFISLGLWIFSIFGVIKTSIITSKTMIKLVKRLK